MIRDYRPGDHLAIASIFSRAVHEIACQAYTPAQCKAWSDKVPNPEHWDKRCQQKRPFVYELDGKVLGFLELDPDGHIDCTYVHPDHARKGIASALVDHALQAASRLGLDRVYVEASLFAKKGFCVIRENLVPIRGEKLVNYEMEWHRRV